MKNIRNEAIEYSQNSLFAFVGILFLKDFYRYSLTIFEVLSYVTNINAPVILWNLLAVLRLYFQFKII